jgi:oxygen-independent coproporphyrinogen-3 oxidase
LPLSLSLYIHIPFCKSKCFYCSFVSFEKKDSLITPYLEALKKEAKLYQGSLFETIYIGGGTPTVLSSDELKSLFSVIHSNFNLVAGAEVTLEANPATFDFQKAKVLRDLGANRASLGVQSLNDKNLKGLGRPHTARDAVLAFDILRRAGFNNINCDLIYSLPGQGEKEIKADVDQLVSWGSEHVSLYSLSIAAGSALHARNIEPLSAEHQTAQYQFVAGFLKNKGFLHYEVSNFAKPGHLCRHNLNYWRGGDYIGLGAGAHAHLNGSRSWNAASIESYITMIQETGSAKKGEERLLPAERFMETFLIALRLTEGVDIQELEFKFSVKLAQEKREVLDGLIRHGLLIEEGRRLKATLSGMMVLDEICSRLI